MGELDKEKGGMSLKVDFFIIGAPKCGTTAMAQYLGENPQICFSSPKELNFFCPEEYPLDSIPQELDVYHASYFNSYNPDLHKMVGEGSAYYLKSPYAVPRILEYNPDAKFIVMLRNPVEMVQSWHREMLRWFIQDEPDLLKAWELQRLRRQGKRLPEKCRQPSGLQYKEVCLLGKQVERLLSVAPKVCIHFILFDEFCANTGLVYRNACGFLGVSGDDRKDFPVVHEARVWKTDALRRLYSYAYKVKTGVIGNRPLPGRIDEKLKSRFGLLVKPESKRVSFDAADFFKKEFSDDVKLLADIIDRDLSHWLA